MAERQGMMRVIGIMGMMRVRMRVMMKRMMRRWVMDHRFGDRLGPRRRGNEILRGTAKDAESKVIIEVETWQEDR